MYVEAQLNSSIYLFICDRHFDYLMNIFIDVVLNWDVDRGCSRCLSDGYAERDLQTNELDI